MINKILIFGAGYVGSSIAVLLAQFYEVMIVDIDKSKVNNINNRQPPVGDSKMAEYLENKQLNISATSKYQEHLLTADSIILALPTNFDNNLKKFDTSIIEDTLDTIASINFDGPIIIKSTVPSGFTKNMQGKYSKLNIFFVPEFLREGQAITDNLYPSRIIIGGLKGKHKDVAKIFNSIALNNPVTVYMTSTEAEAVKLFSNAFLAVRVSIFNELDSFALAKGLNTKKIIKGLSLDPRIGAGYNNPSFGYGGYCLPKDTKQLHSDFGNIPQSIFSAVIDSNIKRKNFIAKSILTKEPSVVGFYRLIMKKGSDNFRESAVFDIVNILVDAGIEVIIYEPLIQESFQNCKLENNFETFIRESNIIIANRMDSSLKSVEHKVFTRDVYGEN